jgi:hypothetical protein
LRSSPKTCDFYLSGIPRVQDSRLLRSRTGINPLATVFFSDYPACADKGKRPDPLKDDLPIPPDLRRDS